MSTLRKFCSFCVEQKWLHSNPAKTVANVGTFKGAGVNLNDFKEALGQDEVRASDIQDIEADVKEFLSL